MCDLPRPEFVIADVECYSYSTALDLSNNSYLINATNDGYIYFRLLSNYRCVFQANIKDIIPGFSEDLLRINAICYCAQYLFVQLKSNNIYVLKCNINEEHISTLSYVTRWSSFEMSFGKCFCLANRYLAFLSCSDHELTIADTDNIDRTLRVKIKVQNKKLESKNEVNITEEKNDGHGVITSFYLFLLNLPKIFFEKQALFILVSYEDGHLIMFGSALDVCIDSLQMDPHLEALEVSQIQLHKELITCFDFNQSNLRGVCGSTKNEIAIFDFILPEVLTTSEIINENNPSIKLNYLIQKRSLCLKEDQVKRIKIVNEGILCCVIRPDGRIFATGGKDGRIRLFALRSGKPLVVISHHTNAIEVMQFTPHISSQSAITKDTKKRYLLFACSRDRSISVWSLYNNTSPMQVNVNI